AALTIYTPVVIKKRVVSVFLYFMNWVTPVNKVTTTAKPAWKTLYKVTGFDGGAMLVLNIAFHTGMDVTTTSCRHDKARNTEPTNIQNSREYVSSSFLLIGISLRRATNSTMAIAAKMATSTTKCQNIPRSVNACTEVSPKIPLRVRKDAYNTSTKLMSV